MTFLLRRPFIYIIIAIVVLVLILQFSGVFSPKPTMVITPSLSASQITMNSNATLTLSLVNKGSQTYSVVCHIVFTSNLLAFYNKNGTLLSSPIWNGKNYTITYPKMWNWGPGEGGTIEVLVKGLNPGQASAICVIRLEVWANGALVDWKTLSLTITQT